MYADIVISNLFNLNEHFFFFLFFFLHFLLAFSYIYLTYNNESFFVLSLATPYARTSIIHNVAGTWCKPKMPYIIFVSPTRGTYTIYHPEIIHRPNQSASLGLRECIPN